MYSFRNDYSEGAHPKVLQALEDEFDHDWRAADEGYFVGVEADLF